MINHGDFVREVLGFQFPYVESEDHMQLINKNLLGIVKGTEATLANPNKLIEWEKKDDKSKVIIGLALLDLELHHVCKNNSTGKLKTFTMTFHLSTKYCRGFDMSDNISNFIWTNHLRRSGKISTSYLGHK